MKYLKNTLFFSLSAFAMFFLFIPMGIRHIFGDITLESIIFHIFMPKIGMSFDWLYALSIYLIIFLLLTLLLCRIYAHYTSKKVRITLFFLILGVLCFDSYYLIKHFEGLQYLKHQFSSSNFIAKHYVDPRKIDIQFPKQKQNLLFIQVESLEASLQDKQNGGLLNYNYITQLTKLAKQNVNFSPSDKVGGAIVLPESGWTMGGLIAETAAIPLKSYRIH